MMDQSPAIPHDVAQDAAEPHAGPAGRLAEALGALRLVAGAPRTARARRVALLLAAVWIVGIFDLILTILASRIGGFVELNPVVSQILHAWELLVAFKLATLSFASAVFLKYRTRVFTEVSCWAMFALHAGLAVTWMQYYVALP